MTVLLMYFNGQRTIRPYWMLTTANILQSDSSIAAQTSGCFPGDALVLTQDGRRLPVSRLSVGERVLSADPATGKTFFDNVVAVLHRSPPTGTGNMTSQPVRVV